MATTKKPKSVAAPSKGRAAKGVKEGSATSQKMADRFQQQAVLTGRSADKPGVVRTPSLYQDKKTPGSSTPRARAADAAYAGYKGLAKKGK
jgi:hypothetical protein